MSHRHFRKRAHKQQCDDGADQITHDDARSGDAHGQRTAEKSPVPIAPPIAIMLSCPLESWRESCSPCSMPRLAASLVFIRDAGTA